MTTTENLKIIIDKIERLYADAYIGADDLDLKVDEIRTDLYWAYREAQERGE